MITLFRNFAKSKWAIGLLVLLALGLLVTGGSQVDVFANLGPKNVISAGSRDMNQTDFRADFERVRNNLQEEAGRPVSIEDMIAENIHLRFLESQTQRLGFLSWAWDVGIRPGKELVLKQIRQAPVFFNQITGQFDEEQYRSVLAQQNLTPAQLEQEFRDQYATNHYAAALLAGARLPRVYGALVANVSLETRDARWFVVTQEMAGQAAAPTDAQLNAFLSENAAQVRRPELRVVTLVLFGGGEAPPISEARIQERFEFRKDALSQPETRTIITLTAPDRAAADRIAAALRGGQSPAEAGRANGNIRPVEYADTARSALADPAVAAGAFALTAPGVTNPIQGRVGFTVAQVTAISPGREVALADIREAIVAELTAEDDKGRTYERVEAYEKARSSGQSLEAAAQSVGARIRKAGPFSEDGAQADGQRVSLPPIVFTTAWALGRGGESEVTDAGDGQYFVVRVDEVRPPSMPTIDELREPLTQGWTSRENSRLLSAKSEELAARVRGGEDIAAVAASVGATLVTRTGVQQNQATQEEIGAGVLQGVFGQKSGQVFAQPQSQTAFVVGRVDRITPPAATAAPTVTLAEQVRPRMTEEIVGGMGEQGVSAAATRSKARYDIGVARQALGLAAEAETPAAPTPAG